MNLRNSLCFLSAGIFPLLAACSGCGIYKDRTAAARAAFYRGEFSRAADLYSPGAEKPGRNRLLYLLDKGMALHAARRYQESIETLLLADRLIDELNYSHLEGAASIVFDDRSLTYRGEEFETVLVNTFLALNFLQQGGPLAAEDALVECRKINWKLKLLNEYRGRSYLQNAFARYLSGVAYELDNEPNDAYVEYQKVHELRPDFVPVQADLLRLSARLGFKDHLERWMKEFGSDFDPGKLAGTGEVVLILETGRAPEKGSHDEFTDLPVYYSYRSWERRGRLFWNGEPLAETVVLEDIDATARRTLSDRMKAIIARRTAKAALKAGAAWGVRQTVRHNTRNRMEGGNSRAVADLTGILVLALLNASDKADTRSWLTLPARLQVARVRLPAGRHTLKLKLLRSSGAAAGHDIEFQNVQVNPGRITLLSTRVLK